MKIHYGKYPRVTYTACGLYQYGKFINGSWVEHSAHYELRVTRCKKKVTCKKCKQSAKYKK